jgi:hypothetical protein
VHVLKDSITFCTADLNSINEDKDYYGYSWSQFNQTHTPPFGFSFIYDSFHYKSTTDIPYIGKTNTYSSGGYMFDLRGKLSYIQGNLTMLENMEWIDRQTRAIFVEFNLYNPNANLLAVISILFEFSMSGNVVSTPNIVILNLFNGIQNSGEYDKVTLGCLVIYMIAVLIIMVIEMRSMLLDKSLLRYFLNFWNLLTWSLIGLSWYSLAIFIYKMQAVNELLDFFKATSGYGYFNMQRLAYFNSSLVYSLAFCCFLSVIKFLRIFQLSQKIYSIVLVLIECESELLNFATCIGVYWISFTSVFYCLFKDDNQNYSSFIKTFFSLFLLAIGKSDASSLFKVSSILGPIIYFSFVFITTCFMLNILVSILCEAFGKVTDRNKKANDLLDYMFEKVDSIITQIFTKDKNIKNPKVKIMPYVNKDDLKNFTESVNKLIMYTERVFINL